MRIAFTILILAQSAFGASWYVDHAASGSNAGTSWANAWTNLNAITWSSVSGGDTIWVSQGEYYYCSVGKAGDEGAPITIKASQESGRNGGVTNSGFAIAYKWITIDGAKDDSATNTYVSTASVSNIAQNIGWHIVKTNESVTDGGGTCINVSGTATNGIRLLWLEMMQTSDHQEDYGVRFNYSGYALQWSNEVAYCWIHNVGQDGIKNAAGSSPPPAFGATRIHHCLIEQTGDDGVELNSGYDVGNCIIRNARDEINRGHPDAIAGQTFSWSRYYNNIIWGFKRSQCFYPATLVAYNTNLWIYGNVVYWGDTNTAESAKTTASIGMEDLYWDTKYSNVPGVDTNIYWNGIRIFNNTFASYPPYSTTPFSFFNRYKDPKNGSNEYVCTVWITNSIVANNAFIGGVGGAFGPAEKIECGSNRMAFFYNLAWSTNTEGRGMATSDGGVIIGLNGNTTNQPTFISAGNPQWDYRLAASDTGARGAGTNLSAYLTDMPSLDVDIWGTSRGGSAWDIGAAQYTPSVTNLIVWLRFTNDFSVGPITDSSGCGHDFIRTGVVGTSYPSNYLTSIVPNQYPGTYTNAAALAWEYYLQSPDPRESFENGTWAALTNVNSFTNMTNMSFAFWAAPDTNRNNYSATVLSAGLNGVGTWSVGRYFSYSPTNNLKWIVTTNYAGAGDWDRERSIMWPAGLNGVWHHYAGTFSNGVCRIYLDGVLTNTTTLQGVTALTVTPEASREDTGQAYMPWIALGCQTHNGNPYIADYTDANDYPNNGWWSGGIGDVRIYNSVLTGAEVAALAVGGGTDGGGTSPGSSPTGGISGSGIIRGNGRIQ